MKNKFDCDKVEIQKSFMTMMSSGKRLLMFFLTLTIVGGLSSQTFAVEKPKAENNSQQEQRAKSQKALSDLKLKVAQQDKERSVKLVQNCKQIIANLEAGESYDTQLKEITAYKRRLDQIKAFEQKSQKLQSKDPEGTPAPKEALRRTSVSKTAATLTPIDLLDEVISNQSQLEKFKESVQKLATYLETESKNSKSAEVKHEEIQQ